MIYSWLNNKIDLYKVCSEATLSVKIDEVFNKTYSEVYILTHPLFSEYFRDLSKSEIDKSIQILQNSIKKYSVNEKVLAILTFETLDVIQSRWKKDKFYNYFCEIYKIMQDLFKSSLYPRIQSGWLYSEKHGHKLPIRFSSISEEIKVTARWVYWEWCVLSTLEGFSKVHNIPAKNCFLDIDESIVDADTIDYNTNNPYCLNLISNLECGQISLEELLVRREWNKFENIYQKNY
jgi:hypothetical protein